MHTVNTHLIKDRRYMFKTYPQAFIGNEVVTYLLETSQAPTREMAVILINILQENNILHHGKYQNVLFVAYIQFNSVN